VIALFGPTDPRRTGPYGQIKHAMSHPLPCAPCMKDKCSNPRALECLELITPAAVASRASALLAKVE
jgi:ADP-heptose:LPS heptosyltransferase